MTKWRSGKQPEFAGLASTFVKVIEAHGFNQMPISVEHALHAASLPLHRSDSAPLATTPATGHKVPSAVRFDA
jgi:hypothetical protein